MTHPKCMRMGEIILDDFFLWIRLLKHFCPPTDLRNWGLVFTKEQVIENTCYFNFNYCMKWKEKIFNGKSTFPSCLAVGDYEKENL